MKGYDFVVSLECISCWCSFLLGQKICLESMCADRDYFQHFKQLFAHNTHVWLMLLFLINMAQQTCLDAMVFVFLHALDFLHQSNYIKKRGFHTVLSYYMQLNSAWMCNHSRWGVPSNSTINYAELCLKLCPISSHFHSCFAVVPWGCFQVSPKIFSFCGMKDDWREDLDEVMMTDDDWPSCFFPLQPFAVNDIQLTEGC